MDFLETGIQILIEKLVGSVTVAPPTRCIDQALFLANHPFAIDTLILPRLLLEHTGTKDIKVLFAHSDSKNVLVQLLRSSQKGTIQPQTMPETINDGMNVKAFISNLIELTFKSEKHTSLLIYPGGIKESLTEAHHKAQLLSIAWLKTCKKHAIPIVPISISSCLPEKSEKKHRVYINPYGLSKTEYHFHAPIYPTKETPILALRHEVLEKINSIRVPAKPRQLQAFIDQRSNEIAQHYKIPEDLAQVLYALCEFEDGKQKNTINLEQAMAIIGPALRHSEIIGPALCHADIIMANNFSILKNEVIRLASKDSLVLFDVDDVLIAPTDEFNFRSKIRKDLTKEIAKNKTYHEVEVIFSDFFLKRKMQLVNENMPKLLEFLRDEKISASALSAWKTDNFGTIQKMEKQRLKELEQVKISFDDLSPFNEDIRFTSNKTEHGGTPMVISGIILAGFNGDKGKAIGLALNSLHKKFKRIILIDDQEKHLKEVEKFCAQHGLDFAGIHYTESSLAPIPEFDSAKEKMRFNILEEEHVWLSDSELEERVNNPT